jgi:hypothetical protein
MVSANTWERFDALGQGTNRGDALAALPLPGAGTHYLAKGLTGEPILLLRVTKRRVPRIPLGLRHVQVEFDVECAIRDLDDEIEEKLVTATFCRAICDPAAPGLHPLFAHALAGAVEGLPAELSPVEADRFFADAVELFRSFSAPPSTSILGLWGELLIIAISPCKDTLVTGWHVAADQTFDFAFPRACLEVKTTARHNRQHDFSLAQLRGGHLPVVVASVVTEPSDAGESVLELATAVQDELSPTNRVKLWRMVAESVGSDADDARDMRFLRVAAINSLRFYDAAALPVPEISTATAGCISAVRFSLDFDRAPTVVALDPQEVWRILG